MIDKPVSVTAARQPREHADILSALAVAADLAGHEDMAVLVVVPRAPGTLDAARATAAQAGVTVDVWLTPTTVRVRYRGEQPPQ
jgi:hypothetical protein